MLEGNEKMKALALSVRISWEDVKDFEAYLLEKERAKATIQKYRTDLATFFRFLGEKREIEKKNLLEYKEWLMERYAINSVNSMIAALNQFLEFLDVGYLKIKRVKMQKNTFLSEERELTRKEYERLLRTARKLGKEQLALCMETIAFTGVRVSELKFFTVERVKKGRIEVCNKGKYRKIFLPDVLRKNLLSYCKKKRIKKGYIFITKNGKPKDRSNIWSEMKALKEKSGIDGKKIFPHNLRHLFARSYYQFTKDLSGLADLLGHSSLNVTRIYTKNTERFYQKKLNQMAREKMLH